MCQNDALMRHVVNLRQIKRNIHISYIPLHVDVICTQNILEMISIDIIVRHLRH